MPDALMISQALLWVIVIVLSLVCLALVRQVGILYERVAPAGALSVNKKLRAGENAPEMELIDIDGGRVQIGGTRADGKSLLLFFMSPDCPVCKTLIPVLRSLDRAERDWLDIALASDGPEDAHRKLITDQGLENFPYLLSEPLGRALGVAQLPYAVLIGADGVIAAMGLVNTREHIESLFEAKDRGVTSIQEYLKLQEPELHEPDGDAGPDKKPDNNKDGATDGSL